METPGSRLEPAFQGRPLPSLGKDENPESKFPENDGIDGDVWFMCAKPLHDARIRLWFRRLAQNVGVDQILHSASVNSEWMGAKKSFRGQASSQSMAPSFRGAVRRQRGLKVSIVPDDDHISAECLDNAGVKFELYLQN